MSARAALGADAGTRLALSPAHRALFEHALARCAAERVAARVWEGDHTLWKPGPAEIANRLGWLRSCAAMRRELARIETFVAGVRADGVADVLLLGMGGSSLAPEVFTKTFGAAAGHPRVSVLDSTDPGAVLAAAARFPPDRTLYLVSTKSGGTVETLSFFKYFYALAVERLGREAAGRRFAAITDPGSSLAARAREIGAREIFLNDPDVGGRFSALTFFGLVPAALDGVDLGALLDRAEAMAARCGEAEPAANPGVALGALVGALAVACCDKLTLVCSPALAGFGAWVEQLVAESTGKEGRGILPVDGARLDGTRRFGGDRLFVFLLLAADRGRDAAMDVLAAAGHAVVELRLADALDLGGEFFRWEFATAVAGWLLGVNPFDQPDVESAKVRANRALAAYREHGSLPAPSLELAAPAAAAELAALLGASREGDYVAVQAFVDPAALDVPVRALADAIEERSGRAVTVGYGPRFLHSTGQLHKGGPAGAICLQLVTADAADVPIPDDFGARAGSVGFGVLKAAQSLGDLAALEAAGRRVLRVALGGGAAAPAQLEALAAALLAGR